MHGDEAGDDTHHNVLCIPERDSREVNSPFPPALPSQAPREPAFQPPEHLPARIDISTRAKICKQRLSHAQERNVHAKMCSLPHSGTLNEPSRVAWGQINISESSPTGSMRYGLLTPLVTPLRGKHLPTNVSRDATIRLQIPLYQECIDSCTTETTAWWRHNFRTVSYQVCARNLSTFHTREREKKKKTMTAQRRWATKVNFHFSSCTTPNMDFAPRKPSSWKLRENKDSEEAWKLHEIIFEKQLVPMKHTCHPLPTNTHELILDF